ncbi:hypothetical protein MAV_5067 [Mycobacterium avium 104]|uniref:Uncharacterized protein n=1 Tax=Mycobacterium avium (strain 104) TaxID=243243 RepID=A0A0H3A1U4_MYCA1|nr:hypothetical protein MAV_5067 [Mycobacterium avium 104]
MMFDGPGRSAADPGHNLSQSTLLRSSTRSCGTPTIGQRPRGSPIA